MKSLERIPYTIDEIVEMFKEKRYLYGRDLINKFGEKSVGHMIDMEECFPMGYGAHYIYCKSGYIIFPHSEDHDFLLSSYVKMDEKWAIELEKTIKVYEELINDIKETMSSMEELIHSQRIRRIFK